MKILHVIFSMLTGGTESMLVDIANEQAARNHDVELLVVNSGINEELLSRIDRRVRLTRFNRKEGSMPLLLMCRLNIFILRRHPDVIHMHSYKLPGLVRVMRKRIIFTVHAPHTPLKYAHGIRLSAISNTVKDYIQSVQPSASVRVIANGINTANITRRPRGKAISSPIRIVQAGRLDMSIKGQDILIRAINILNRRGLDATASFIGGGADLLKLQQLANALAISDKIFFTGEVTRDSLHSMLGTFDIMCHPSRYEGFGLTVAEGMAAGLPLAVTRGDGPWEIADCGRLCHSFEAGNAEACADALQKIIEEFPAALTTADEAMKFVERRYSVKRMVDDFIDYYQHL